MIVRNLNTNKIFTVLNSIKQSIGLGVSSFIDNGLNKEQAIKGMENHFNDIIETINQYYNDKKVKNRIRISIQLNEKSDINFWNDKKQLETLKINLAHKFDIPLKWIQTKIDF